MSKPEPKTPVENTPKKPRKAPFRASEFDRKVLNRALDYYQAKVVADMPDDGFVSRDEVQASIAKFKDQYPDE